MRSFPGLLRVSLCGHLPAGGQTMRQLRAGVFALILAAACGASGTARADETLLCSRYITTVPAVITRPGHYCLAANISTAMAIGPAISIQSDDVFLDLNNFTLDNS